MSGYLINAELLGLIRRTIRQVLGEYRNAEGHRGKYQQKQRHLQGKLDGGLDAAADSTTTPATAVMSVYEKNSSGNMVDSGRDITVTNRFQYADASAGSWCKAEWIDGEWQLYAVDCGA
jgi:hypothetical protein